MHFTYAATVEWKTHTAAADKERERGVLSHKQWQNECDNLAIKSNEKWLFHFIETILWFYVFLYFILWLLPIFVPSPSLPLSRSAFPVSYHWAIHGFGIRIWFYRWSHAMSSQLLRVRTYCAVGIYVILPYSIRSIFIFYFYYYSLFSVKCVIDSIHNLKRRIFFLVLHPSPRQCDTGNWNYLLEYFSWNQRYVSVIKLFR